MFYNLGPGIRDVPGCFPLGGLTIWPTTSDVVFAGGYEGYDISQSNY